jgi:hypothetical protein
VCEHGNAIVESFNEPTLESSQSFYRPQSSLQLSVLPCCSVAIVCDHVYVCVRIQIPPLVMISSVSFFVNSIQCAHTSAPRPRRHLTPAPWSYPHTRVHARWHEGNHQGPVLHRTVGGGVYVARDYSGEHLPFGAAARYDITVLCVCVCVRVGVHVCVRGWYGDYKQPICSELLGTQLCCLCSKFCSLDNDYCVH